MNGPYYRNHIRSVPVHKPKVVSIPVHFVSSEDHHLTQKLKHSSAALKIQKVFKGHTVRKALNQIVSIKNQVDNIEERLQNDFGFVKMLRNDGKERLRVNETLMSLLFKLDSVRGIENGVREVRKSVAKKAVALQEKVDSIAQTIEDKDGDDDVSNDEKTDGDDVINKHPDQGLVVNEAMNDDSLKECDDDVSNKLQDKVNEDVIDDDVIKNEVMIEEDTMKECDDDVGNNNVRNQESVENDEEIKECVEERVTDEGDDDVSRRCCDKGMVEKLICDNAKMMKLIIQISERNELQTRMINSLSKRVEQLEKAFMNDKSRRRKKSYSRGEKDSFCI